MSINSTLKKEGIKVIGQLNTLEINKIASNISEKIVSSFPEHNINQSNLFISLARLNMYIAEMPNDDNSMAKYFYKNNSIYFSKDMDLEDINTLCVHECIHFIQELKNKNGKLIRLGLYNLEGAFSEGLGLNEAAVQHMAAIAVKAPLDQVKYYNLEFATESPDYYPIITSLINEMIFFTGSYPLYHSVFNSNDIFKNTFIAKSSEKTYTNISINFDLILKYEELLAKHIYKLSILSDEKSSINKIKKLNSKIDAYKQVILEKTLETQNIILLDCFTKSLSNIKTLENVKNFEEDIEKIGNILINSENYNFYKDFKADMLNQANEKKDFILKYGNILALDSITYELAEIKEHTYGYKFFSKLFYKLKLLFEDAVRQKNIEL